ncbi:MAG TPA: hypothetical protein VFE51_30010 [Verrucomicrobiae bacterium]|nr:hypothetical protein [Verrucomicrobiae bacterium]
MRKRSIEEIYPPPRQVKRKFCWKDFSLVPLFVIEASDFIGNIALHEKIQPKQKQPKRLPKSVEGSPLRKRKSSSSSVPNNSVVGVGVDHEGTGW